MKNEKSFLEIIDDIVDRRYPINYKFVEIRNMPAQVKNRKYFNVDLYQTNKCEPNLYYKPISKLI